MDVADESQIPADAEFLGLPDESVHVRAVADDFDHKRRLRLPRDLRNGVNQKLQPFPANQARHEKNAHFFRRTAGVVAGKARQIHAVGNNLNRQIREDVRRHVAQSVTIGDEKIGVAPQHIQGGRQDFVEIFVLKWPKSRHVAAAHADEIRNAKQLFCHVAERPAGNAEKDMNQVEIPRQQERNKHRQRGQNERSHFKDAAIIAAFPQHRRAKNFNIFKRFAPAQFAEMRGQHAHRMPLADEFAGDVIRGDSAAAANRRKFVIDDENVHRIVEASAPPEPVVDGSVFF